MALGLLDAGGRCGMGEDVAFPMAAVGGEGRSMGGGRWPWAWAAMGPNLVASSSFVEVPTIIYVLIT